MIRLVWEVGRGYELGMLMMCFEGFSAPSIRFPFKDLKHYVPRRIDLILQTYDLFTQELQYLSSLSLHVQSLCDNAVPNTQVRRFEAREGL